MKIYLSEEKTQQLITTVSKNYSEKTVVKMNRNEVKDEQDIARTLLARDYKGFGNQDMNGVIEPKAERIGGIFDKDGKTHQAGAVWDKEQLSPTLDTMQGGWRQPSVVIGEIVKDFDIPKEILNDNERQRRVYSTNGISPAVLARADSAKIHNCFRIRKLTPKECWRLMGFSDDDFHKAEEVNSNTQLYKQAGNSIVVDVLEGIFGQLFEK